MKILLTGASGILGTAFRRLAEGEAALAPELPDPPFRPELVALSRADLDVTDPDAVAEAVAAHAPDAVVHCAAYTAVDRAESEPLLARAVNVKGTAHVARAAAEAGAVMVYPSTDFVFDGERVERPWRPDDPTGPLGVYGRTKLEGEEAVRAVGGPHMVVRTSWVYGAGGRNFVDAILERARSGAPLRIVADQTGRPTWSRNLAVGILELLEREARDVWHVADAGAVTWHAFAARFLEMAGVEAEPEPVSTEAFGAAARRPRWSVLDTSATEALLGRPMPAWEDSVARYLAVPKSAQPR